METARPKILVRYILLTGLSVGFSLGPAGAELPLPIGSATDPPLRYTDTYASGSYQEAVDAAKMLVSEVIARDGDNLAYADALEKLAQAQQAIGEIPAAIQNFRDAINKIQSAEDMLAVRLIAPLTGLATSLEQGNELAEAVATYERAAHISRVNEGPMNLTQCAILTNLVDLFVSQSMFGQATDIQSYQLEIYRRSLDETDPRVLGAWRRKGEMLSLAGNHRQAQELYQAAMDFIRVADGRYSLSQIPLLNDLSESYLSHASADSFTRIEMARAQLQRAVLITVRNPEASNLQRSTAYLRMGDFMQRFGNWKSALKSYRLAWGQLGETSSLRELRDAEFSAPAVLNLSVLRSTPTPLAITVAYNVNSRGQVDDARVQHDPAIDSAARRALTLTRKLVFRPRFDNGDPVSTPDLVHQVFVRE